MRCSKCRDTAIHFQPYSGQHLCRNHFIADIEAKAKREIRRHQGIRPGDRIGVVTGYGLQEEVLLHFLQKLTRNRRDIQVVEIPGAPEEMQVMKQARECGITRIARAFSLEDRAAATLTAILQGDAARCFFQTRKTPGVIPVITPFCHIPAEEIVLYARLHGISGDLSAPLQGNDPLYTDVLSLLADYSSRHPAAPHAVINLAQSLAAVRRAGEDDRAR
ncbi:MAG: hypothetical protein GX651_05465 [Methanomicrobiales archaeon]|nr:hypothetical protein [Methanomicrobiales archaeon]